MLDPHDRLSQQFSQDEDALEGYQREFGIRSNREKSEELLKNPRGFLVVCGSLESADSRALKNLCDMRIDFGCGAGAAF